MQEFWKTDVFPNTNTNTNMVIAAADMIKTDAYISVSASVLTKDVGKQIKSSISTFYNLPICTVCPSLFCLSVYHLSI